jgi:hypothetical protein
MTEMKQPLKNSEWNQSQPMLTIQKKNFFSNSKGSSTELKKLPDSSSPKQIQTNGLKHPIRVDL